MKQNGLGGWEQHDPGTLNYYMEYFSNWIGAPSNLLLAVAMKESSYNPETGVFNNVCNRVSACGLMQLRPIALKDIQRRWGYQLDPLDPIQAIIGAALMFWLNRGYLKYYTKRNPGWDDLIVAYNGGWQMGYRFMTGQAISAESQNYLAFVGGQTGWA